MAPNIDENDPDLIFGGDNEDIIQEDDFDLIDRELSMMEDNYGYQ